MRKVRSAPRRRHARNLILAVTIPLVIAISVVIATAWYNWALKPLDRADSNKVKITIRSGSLTPDIARDLTRARIIRSGFAFEIYAKIHNQENKLQAGTYAFAPNQSVSDIVGHLTSGKTDQFSVTILPGQTLKDIRTMLEGHGYGAAEIDAAMNASYTGSLLASRGTQTSLEGFFYPDTYSVLSDEPLPALFQRIFDHYDDILNQDNLSAGFAAHGLSVYQGITLASIVQKEVPSTNDQRLVAGVFYNRLDADMSLQSDVTFQYGASLLGVEASSTLNSPYNTYIIKGLPPTPIASPELSALKAVADPAQSDYIYFVAGDDDMTYYAKTDAEHQANVAEHCKTKCQ